MNKSIYKISGLGRKRLKKELNELKSLKKYFWHFHQLDKDMASFYNTKNKHFPASDIQAQKKYDELISKIENLEQQLKELINQTEG